MPGTLPCLLVLHSVRQSVAAEAYIRLRVLVGLSLSITIFVLLFSVNRFVL
jgi:hypothetical protein